MHAMRSTVLLAALLAFVPLAAAAESDLRGVYAQWNRLRVEDLVRTGSDGKVQHKADYLAVLDRRTRVNRAIDNHDVEVRR